MQIAGLDTHPAADLFPLMEGKELADLAANIRIKRLFAARLEIEMGKKPAMPAPAWANG